LSLPGPEVHAALAYFESKSGFIVEKSTGTETCSWLMSHWPFTFL
jgi:hypothetical protein